MNIKRKPSLAAIATAVVVFNFTSCKYEDGPSISLRTKKSRLTGEWEAKWLDGTAIDDGSVILEFEKDGDFVYTASYSYYGYSSSYSYKGEWNWEDDKQSVEIEIDGEKIEWEITRLTNKELEFEDEDNNKWELEKK